MAVDGESWNGRHSFRCFPHSFANSSDAPWITIGGIVLPKRPIWIIDFPSVWFYSPSDSGRVHESWRFFGISWRFLLIYLYLFIHLIHFYFWSFRDSWWIAKGSRIWSSSCSSYSSLLRFDEQMIRLAARRLIRLFNKKQPRETEGKYNETPATSGKHETCRSRSIVWGAVGVAKGRHSYIQSLDSIKPIKTYW